MKKTFSILFILTVLLLLFFSFLQNPSFEKATKEVSIKILKLEKRYLESKSESCDFDMCYEIELNDRVYQYLEESYLNGIQKSIKGTKEIQTLVDSEKLCLIQENEFYVLDTMHYSYPFLTPSAKKLLNEIGKRFQDKLENTGLECSRFTLTSMLRTTNSVARLRKWNRNSIKNSAHLHGTTFDVSYKTFFANKELSSAECMYLGDALSKTIWELRKENKCFATYETWQTCLHIVSR